MKGGYVTAIGWYFFEKYRARAKEAGVFTVAKQMRKQGVPVEIVRLILLGRE